MSKARTRSIRNTKFEEKLTDLVRVTTSTISGLTAATVQVEVSLKTEYKGFQIIGLADTAVREARDRVALAIKSSGHKLPDKIIVNLSPASIKKEGSVFDLAMAVGVLVAAGVLPGKVLLDRSFQGELGLDGSLKAVRGMIASALHASKLGLKEIIVPYDNYSEAALIDTIKVTPVRSLHELMAYLLDELIIDQPQKTTQPVSASSRNDIKNVFGQELAKRALVIAAAGAHNLLLLGPPGCGKSMLAECFPSLLPELSDQEKLETATVYSIAGLDLRDVIQGYRPYRSPHHVISEAGLVGGGSNPRPGEISLAHNGVLFLDEFPEFRRGVLESLRAPLENYRVRVTRAKCSVEFPARFQLLAAMNPCPCGRLGVDGLQCSCSKVGIQTYLKKLSQPILDRIDLHVELEVVPLDKITLGTKTNQYSSSDIRSVVAGAQSFAIERAGKLNARLSNQELESCLNASEKALSLLDRIAQKHNVSARSYFRMLKVARTIADLSENQQVDETHIVEAFRYRGLERIKEHSS